MLEGFDRVQRAVVVRSRGGAAHKAQLDEPALQVSDRRATVAALERGVADGDVAAGVVPCRRGIEVCLELACGDARGRSAVGGFKVANGQGRSLAEVAVHRAAEVAKLHQARLQALHLVALIAPLQRGIAGHIGRGGGCGGDVRSRAVRIQVLLQRRSGNARGRPAVGDLKALYRLGGGAVVIAGGHARVVAQLEQAVLEIYNSLPAGAKAQIPVAVGRGGGLNGCGLRAVGEQV